MLSKAVKEMGSPGKVNGLRYKAGMFLNVMGYVLLLIGTFNLFLTQMEKGTILNVNK